MVSRVPQSSQNIYIGCQIWSSGEWQLERMGDTLNLLKWRKTSAFRPLHPTMGIYVQVNWIGSPIKMLNRTRWIMTSGALLDLNVGVLISNGILTSMLEVMRYDCNEINSLTVCIRQSIASSQRTCAFALLSPGETGLECCV